MSGKKVTITWYVSPRSSPQSPPYIDQKSGSKNLKLPGSKEPSIEKFQLSPQAVADKKRSEKPAYLKCIDRLYNKMHERDSKLQALRAIVVFIKIEIAGRNTVKRILQ